MKEAMNRKRRAEELVNYLRRIRDDEGYAAVDVYAPSESGLYDPLGGEDKGDLDGGIYDYIEERTDIVPVEIPLKIRFRGACGERERVSSAMHDHYTLRALQLSKKLMANFVQALFLTVFGAAVLAVYLYFALTSAQALFTEILSVVGTFSLWEAVDTVLLQRPALRREMKKINRLLCAVVECPEPSGAEAGSSLQSAPQVSLAGTETVQ